MKRLQQTLSRIDGKGYKAYKDLQGEYHFPRFQLFIDYVQGDPFAAPSRVRVRMPQSEAKYRSKWYDTPHRKVALEDWIARVWTKKANRYSFRVKGTGKSGLIRVDQPGQEILNRTAVVVTKEYVEVRVTVGLPAQGRRVLGRKAEDMLCDYLVRLVDEAIPAESIDPKGVEERMKLVDNQQGIRQYLKKNGWIAFVANGSVLPRKSGVSDQPLQGNHVVKFQAPQSLEDVVEVPHGPPIRGMVIRDGITLIVGGGYHGKSTLLNALERGVYDHIAGDGREYVITDTDAVKVRAEDGRRVEKVNISPFINNLPFGRDTIRFSTEDASGSTSQATNIMESLEMGASCLLIDEDTSATNFMIRDGRMQKLVAKGKEPITPFIDKVRQLYENMGTSSILVLGGSGDYFDVADTVIMMDEYLPYEVTQRAKEVAQAQSNNRVREGGEAFGDVTPRSILANGFDPRKGKKEKVDAKGLHSIQFGTETVDLSGVEQLVDVSQTRAIAEIMRLIGKKANGQKSLRELIEDVYQTIEKKDLDVISPFQGQHPGDLALPRKEEVAAAINRLRTLKVQ
ncbi:ABC-ATPase domain-containing protein [Melghirimyces algeriensis]|uniref:Predicted ATPase of the ABC class n=1 Tax=Melghirimyces algeriensis TaxID=910412 RepID=A0A521FA79_9BACL|nr:ABC-ATPase domain-containing protein [Melghirimyces algeriensis]SMO93075.1 Predicted ATPase of the ABC class [Melghirimyces algeriensis]